MVAICAGGQASEVPNRRAIIAIVLRALPDSLDTSEPASGERFSPPTPISGKNCCISGLTAFLGPWKDCGDPHSSLAPKFCLTLCGGREAAPHLGSVSCTLSFISHHSVKILVGMCGVITAFRRMLICEEPWASLVQIPEDKPFLFRFGLCFGPRG